MQTGMLQHQSQGMLQHKAYKEHKNDIFAH